MQTVSLWQQSSQTRPVQSPLNHPGRSRIDEYMLKTVNTASSLYKDSLVQTGPLPIITKALLVFASIKCMCAVNSSAILHCLHPKRAFHCSSEPKCDQLPEPPVASTTTPAPRTILWTFSMQRMAAQMAVGGGGLVIVSSEQVVHSSGVLGQKECWELLSREREVV